MEKIAIAFLVLGMVACGTVGPLPVAGCIDACANMQRLECQGSQGSPGFDEKYGTDDDVPCIEVCEELSRDSQIFPLACIARAPTCDAVNNCF